MTRRTKWLISGIILVFVLASVGLILFFTLNRHDSYKICGLEHNEYTVADFVDKSELKFYANNTFHLRIEHKDKGLSLLGIGTYTSTNDTYTLTFTAALDHQFNKLDLDPIVCERSNNRIKFTNPNNGQVYYFG